MTRTPGDILNVIVASSKQNFYEGEAKSVSSVNSVGPFDILPRHENFISLIFKKISIVDSSSQKHELVIDKGLLEVSQDRVRIFVGV